MGLLTFKIVQRIIVFCVMSFWLLVGINVIIAIWVYAVTGVDARTNLLELAFSDYCLYPVLAVLSLYVSGGVIPSIFGKKAVK